MPRLMTKQLNEKEKRVLAAFPTEKDEKNQYVYVELADLAGRAFAKRGTSPQTKGNSWVRNSMRKLLALKLVQSQGGRNGAYRLTGNEPPPPAADTRGEGDGEGKTSNGVAPKSRSKKAKAEGKAKTKAKTKARAKRKKPSDIEAGNSKDGSSDGEEEGEAKTFVGGQDSDLDGDAAGTATSA